MAVAEVAMSIAWNGYFQHEPLFVEKTSRGDMVVIEGNRRLAAVKLLLDADLRKAVGAAPLMLTEFALNAICQSFTDKGACQFTIFTNFPIWNH